MLPLAACTATAGNTAATGMRHASKQPVLRMAHPAYLDIAGLRFKDLNRNGTLDPYEDWRLPAEIRARDLVARMSRSQKAGAILHGRPADDGNGAADDAGERWDMAKMRDLIERRHLNTIINQLRAGPAQLAAQANAAQAVAEASDLGIPLSISANPRNHARHTANSFYFESGFAQWPTTLGVAAIGDPARARELGDAARRALLATGINVALAPQADLATEPRWARLDESFGDDPELARELTRAYVAGMQEGETGLHPGSVVATAKHWVGYGAAPHGFDARYRYGRALGIASDSIETHIVPFTGAFAARVGSVMPTYGMAPAGVEVAGVTGPLEPVGAAFSRQMLTDLLRGRFGFQGVVVSDWYVTDDCDDACRNGAPSGRKPAGFAAPWGVETLTKTARVRRALDAGVDQLGGSDDPEPVLALLAGGELDEARLDQSVYRIMLQKFQQGLFENPYVDAAQAASIVGAPSQHAAAAAAQRDSQVLLQNRVGFLPLRNASGMRVFLHRIAPDVAARYGFVVVDRPELADVAVLRIDAPYETLHPNFFGGANEGSLAFEADNPDYQVLIRAARHVPIVASVYLDRPAILSKLVDRTRALLVNFGASDEALLDIVTGRVLPRGRLPVALPASMQAVEGKRPDVADGPVPPLFSRGFGLSYGRVGAHVPDAAVGQ